MLACGTINLLSTQEAHKPTSAWLELAHELRQPLDAIQSLAYYLELTSKDEAQKTHLRQIQSLVLKANQILNQIHEIGKTGRL